MKLTDGEKLILIMLSDLHKKLGIQGGIDGGIDADFVQSAILSDNLWGLRWEYTGLFHNKEDTPEIVLEVCNYLDMWQSIEWSWLQLSNKEKEQVSVDAAPFGADVEFPGFDGNYEGEYMGIARFLVEDLKRYAPFKGRSDKNSGAPYVQTYARMYQVFKAKRASFEDGVMSACQIAEVLKARGRPELSAQSR